MAKGFPLLLYLLGKVDVSTVPKYQGFINQWL